MKLKFFFLLILTLTIIHQTSSIATVRYVSKTGTSTPPFTSWQSAADSIQKCINICVDGDTVYVANGVYKENLIINTAISLIGSSMDSTIIDGRGMGEATITVQFDFNIENMHILGMGNSVGDAAIRNIPALNFLKIKNCIISDSKIGVGWVSILSTSIFKADNLIIKNLTTAFSLSGNGENDITNSIVSLDNESSKCISTGLSQNGNYNIINNLLIFTGAINPGAGISIGAPRKVNISNNIISGFADNIYISIQIIDSVIIRNNILSYHNPGQGNSSIHSINDDPFVENVILANNNAALYGWPIQSNYNLFWNNQSNRINGALGDSDIIADPMFVKDTIPSIDGNYDYHLQAFSPGIDNGHPNILDKDGTRSDIGMFGGPLGEKYTYQDLAPKPPGNLTATMDSGLVHLKWNKNTEADLFRYRVYRDTVPDFIYDTTKIIAVLPDTSFYDDPPQKFISGNYYYKITAIDSAYHQSPASEEVHINITGIPEAPPIVLEHYNLLQNYPNPFNPSTTIPYRLKAPGYVKVMVYNILGEMVKVLVNKYQNVGYYEVLFHPTASERKSAEGKIEFETGYGDIVSGIYLYRIEVIGEGNIPVFTDMKKMMLVK